MRAICPLIWAGVSPGVPWWREWLRAAVGDVVQTPAGEIKQRVESSGFHGYNEVEERGGTKALVNRDQVLYLSTRGTGRSASWS